MKRFEHVVKAMGAHPSTIFAAPRGRMAVQLALENARVRRMQARGVESVKMKGFTIFIDPLDGCISGELYDMGGFEFNEMEVFKSCISGKGPTVVLDVGANIGLYTLTACSMGCEVHAFEPNPRPFSFLSRSLSFNGFQATLNASCLSDAAGVARLTVPSGTNGGLASLLMGSGETLEVPSETLDGYLQKHGIPKVEVMKLDVEGAEALVLEGGTRALQARTIQNIIMEMSPQAWKGHEGISELLRGVYDIWQIDYERRRPLRSPSDAEPGSNVYLRLRG